MIKFIELFAGIGGFKVGIESIEGFKGIFSNDTDKYCKQTFDYNFLESDLGLYLEDIRKIKSNDIPDFDVLTAGFPCQSFSVAGYREGFEDKKDRGNLFFEITRILRDKRPKCFLLENVKNLVSHDKGITFKIMCISLSKVLGYHVSHKILNSSECGNIPQNRERVYIVGFLDENNFNNFQFPEKISLTKTINDCLEGEIDEKYYYNNKPLYEKIKNEVINKNVIYQYRRTIIRENKSGVCPTLVASMGTGGHNVPIILDDLGIRKLTPRECANFQGFPIDYKFPKICDSQIYKQIGNSVTVPVISRIAEKIKRALD